MSEREPELQAYLQAPQIACEGAALSSVMPVFGQSFCQCDQQQEDTSGLGLGRECFCGEDDQGENTLCSDVLKWNGPIRLPQDFEYTPPAILGLNKKMTTYFICDLISFCFCAPHTGFDWEWDDHFKSSGAFLSCGNRKVSFHLDYSSGTAAIRGTKELTDGQHFWEVKMTSPVYGTDMVGIK